MTDQADLYNEQALVEWQPEDRATLSNEQALTEWQPEDQANLSNEQALTEWQAHGAGTFGEHLLVEWTSIIQLNMALLQNLQQLVEWIPSPVIDDSGLLARYPGKDLPPTWEV